MSADQYARVVLRHGAGFLSFRNCGRKAQRRCDIELLLIVLVILLLLGGGVWTSRPGWSGPDVSGFVWVLFAVVPIVLVVRLIGAV